MAKFNVSGTLVWSTNFGGTNGLTQIRRIDFDSNNDILISGLTSSTIGFPLENPGGSYYQESFGGGAFDAFVSKFNGNSLELVWSTYFGGQGNEFLYAACTSNSDDYFIAGVTDNATEFPFEDFGIGYLMTIREV